MEKASLYTSVALTRDIRRYPWQLAQFLYPWHRGPRISAHIRGIDPGSLRATLPWPLMPHHLEENKSETFFPPCAQWCIFCIVRANFQKYDLYSAPIARALPRYIVPFFKFFKTGKCFKTMLFPVSCVSQKPLAFQKHSLLLTQPKTHAKTLCERSEKCATVQVLMGTDTVARAKYLQRAL